MDQQCSSSGIVILKSKYILVTESFYCGGRVASLLSGWKKGARCSTLKPTEKWMHATSEQRFSNREALCLLDNCGIADVVHLGCYILLKREHIFSNGVLLWWGKRKGSLLVVRLQ